MKRHQFLGQLVATAFLLSLGGAAGANAHEGHDHGDAVACATVYPCDEHGNLLPEYDNGEDVCTRRYRQQCDDAKSSASASLGACIDSNSTLQKKVSSLEKRNRRLTKELRRLEK